MATAFTPIRPYALPEADVSASTDRLVIDREDSFPRSITVEDLFEQQTTAAVSRLVYPTLSDLNPALGGTQIIPAAQVAVQTSGYANPSDPGGGRYAYVPSNPGHPGSFQNNGRWFELVDPIFRSSQFGFVSDDYVDPQNPGIDEDPTDNAPFFQALIDAAFATGRVAMLDGGRYWVASQTNLPTSPVATATWASVMPFRVIGSGKGITRIRSTSSTYALAHASINPGNANHKSNRAQYGALEIAHFTLIGPQSYTNNGRGIGLDNCTAPDVHHLEIYGFTGQGEMPDPLKPEALAPPTLPADWDEGDWVGGCGIVIRGYRIGGTYGADIHHNVFGWSGPFATASVSTGDTDIWGRPINTGYTFTDIADLEWACNRTCIWTWGEYTAAGKSNDIRIYNNRFQNPLVCAVNTRGTIGNRTLPIVGSSANITLDGNEAFGQMPGRIEVGTITEYVDSTHVRLRYDPATLFPYPGGREDLYVGFGIQFSGATGNYAAAYITAMDEDSYVTLDRPISNYVANSAYQIQYADERSRFDYNPNVGPHTHLYASKYAAGGNSNYNERITPMVGWTPYVNSKYADIDPNPEVNQGVQFLYSQLYGTVEDPNQVINTLGDGKYYYDGQKDIRLEDRAAMLGYWPQVVLSHTPPYCPGQPKTGLVVGSATLVNTENQSASAPLTYTMVNNTGATRTTGDVVRLGSNMQATTTLDYTSLAGLTAHGVVWGPFPTTTYLAGETMHIVASARNVRVNLDATLSGGAGVIGDYVVPVTGEKGHLIPRANARPTFTGTWDATAASNLNTVVQVLETKLGKVSQTGINGESYIVISVGL